MKTYITAALLVLLVLNSNSKESGREAALRESMKNIGWVTDGVSFHELNPLSPTILIIRDDKLVGYFTVESEWHKIKIEPIDLSNVTAIVFGQGVAGIPESFRIEESAEIAIWVAAYFEHTESEIRYGVFIPTAKNAGFVRNREQIRFGGAYGDNFALRFYEGKKLILSLPGHFELEPTTPNGIRNNVLHELTKAKINALSDKATKSTETKVEQGELESKIKDND